MVVPEIEAVVDKLAHKKFFLAIAFVYLSLSGEVETYELIAATVVAITAIICQTILDWREPNETKDTDTPDSVPEPVL